VHTVVTVVAIVTYIDGDSIVVQYHTQRHGNSYAIRQDICQYVNLNQLRATRHLAGRRGVDTHTLEWCLPGWKVYSVYMPLAGQPPFELSLNRALITVFN